MIVPRAIIAFRESGLVWSLAAVALIDSHTGSSSDVDFLRLPSVPMTINRSRGFFAPVVSRALSICCAVAPI